MWSRLKKIVKRFTYVLSSDAVIPLVPSKNTNAEKPTMRTCLHEAGHYLVARMFPTTIRINILSANKSQLEDGMNGALHITRLGRPTLNKLDHLMLTAAGGIVANTVESQGKAYVLANIQRFPQDTTGLDLFGTTGDYKLIQQSARAIAQHWNFTNEGYIRVQWNGIQHVFLYLMEETIWNAVQVLGQALFDSEGNFLTRTQAEKVLKRAGLVSGLNSVRNDFIDSRYPLTATKQATLV